MKIEDTVMKPEEYELIMDNFPNSGFIQPHHTALLEAQAEITWDIAYKAGYEEREKGLSPNETKRLEEALIAGRKEVVKWIKKNTVWSILFNTAEGKAQLKEWGING